jgi:hypothetical protein
MFADEEYANMHFVFSFCSGNGRAAVALIPTLQKFKSQNVRDCTQLRGAMVPPQKVMQNVNDGGVQEEYFCHQEITPLCVILYMAAATTLNSA